MTLHEITIYAKLMVYRGPPLYDNYSYENDELTFCCYKDFAITFLISDEEIVKTYNEHLTDGLIIDPKEFVKRYWDEIGEYVSSEDGKELYNEIVNEQYNNDICNGYLDFYDIEYEHY
jgi:hypothetical protein